MKIIRVKNNEEMSQKAFEIFKEQIETNKNSILGLATGGTPEGTYKKLVEANLDWSNITTFNLDEYIGIPSSHEMSYRTFMNVNLFDKVNINKENTYIPNNSGDIEANGKAYDDFIASKGGVDLQILGIGENAHIAFNEPGSEGDSITREVQLTESTINANSRYFESADDVPKTAITMGIGTILKAKKIILLASGEKKAQAIFDTVNAPVGVDVPSSFLQNHDNVTLIIDEAAASKL